MKRMFLFVSLLVCFAFAANAREVYCELLGTSNISGSKVKVEVDFGEEKNPWGRDNRDMLVDDNGKPIKFNSMVDAMNYMSQFGWKFKAAYFVSIGGKEVIHWLLYKEVEDDSEIKEGITQKRDLK